MSPFQIAFQNIQKDYHNVHMDRCLCSFYKANTNLIYILNRSCDYSRHSSRLLLGMKDIAQLDLSLSIPDKLPILHTNKLLDAIYLHI